MDLVVLCICGLCAALICARLKLPAGILVGVAAGVAVGQFVLGFPASPLIPGSNSLLQALIGVFVGSRITRSSLAGGARSLFPASVLAVILLCASVLSALFVSRMFSVDLQTSLFAAAPGGLAEMSAVGTSLGADGAVIAGIHLVRLLATIAAVSVITALLSYRHAKSTQSVAEGHLDNGDAGSNEGYSQHTRNPVPGLLGGMLGAGAGLVTMLPAGALVGALCGSAAVALWSDLSFSGSSLKIAVQAFAGATIGLRVDPGLLASLDAWLAAGAVLLAVQMLMWTFTYLILRKAFAYEPITSLFSSAPGGMSDIVSSAPDAGADLTTVAFSHLVRVTAIIVTVPYIVLGLV